MSYQEKIDAILAIIREHNDAVGKDNPGYVDEEKFIKSLKAFGATSEQDLSSLSWEKITDLLVPSTIEGNVIKPEGLARKISKNWRGSKTEESSAPVYVSSKKATRMSPRELLEAFDPEEPDSAAGKRLKSLSKNQPFLIYKQGRIVDVNASLTLLMEVKQGYPARQVYEQKKVYAIGELPEAYAEENPLYPGRPLRPDGSCDQLNRSWDGISTEIRQFVRVMLECKDYKMATRENGHYILDLITTNKDALSLLKDRYQNATVQFEERKNTNSLPSLLVPLSSQGGKKINPFDKGMKVEWYAPPTLNSNFYVSSSRMIVDDDTYHIPGRK